jgi:hypothetical protein
MFLNEILRIRPTFGKDNVARSVNMMSIVKFNSYSGLFLVLLEGTECFLLDKDVMHSLGSISVGTRPTYLQKISPIFKAEMTC